MKKGSHHSKEAKEKLRKANLGKNHTSKQKEKISEGLKRAYKNGKKANTKGNGFKGKTYEEIFGKEKAKEIKEKMSKAKKGNIPWHKGTKGIIKAWNKGKENPNWKGPKNPRWNPNKIDEYGYEFTNKLKEKIRKRDNYKCQNIECDITQEEYLKLFKEKLCIHHIDRNKKNNLEDNLVTLCRKCHGKLERKTILLKNINYIRR